MNVPGDKIVYILHQGIGCRNIVQADLKVENILVATNLVVKVIDFGHAKVVDPNKKASFQLVQYGTKDLSPPEMRCAFVEKKKDTRPIRFFGFEADISQNAILERGMSQQAELDQVKLDNTSLPACS
ncbi:hypothetical protein M427DRAFT_35437 [Gonapodya prolifera JEL478]|uniref:Protein kinase domain-containing protein n=1 Tax=Gonapodya prolifera (strain JEL478) TaxID=1344416 RepID=A0A139A4M3_GONPJ|nr:hypothetical protein M427DRAFT_35437 [Gonapodya prolifera JEL478]|eukprot:KXS11684.1 hypothetical protein M427DRAFT_35437 [Gonapodya prolifera JEL478]